MERYTQYRGVDVYWSVPTDDFWAMNWQQRRGTLTIEHAASSYGVPVLVEEDGHVYGPGELPGVTLHVTVAPTYTTPAIEAARTAGYQVQSAGWGLGATPPAMMEDMLT